MSSVRKLGGALSTSNEPRNVFNKQAGSPDPQYNYYRASPIYAACAGYSISYIEIYDRLSVAADGAGKWSKARELWMHLRPNYLVDANRYRQMAETETDHRVRATLLQLAGAGGGADGSLKPRSSE